MSSLQATFIVYTLVFLFLAGSLLTVWRMTRPLPGPGEWLAAAALAFLGFGHNALGMPFATDISRFVGHFAWGAVVLLLLIGVRRFVGKPPGYRRALFFLAGYGGGLLLSVAAGWSMSARVLWSNALCSGVLLVLIATLIRQGQVGGPARFFTVSCFATLIVALLARMGLIVATAEFDVTSLNNMVLFLVIPGALTAGILGLMLMTMQRLVLDIRLYKAAVQGSPAGIALTDAHGTITHVNPAYCALRGESEAALIGAPLPGTPARPLPALASAPPPAPDSTPDSTPDSAPDLPPDSPSARPDPSAWSWQGERQSRRPDGSVYWEEASVSPLHDAHGAVRHFVAVATDVTPRKTLEQALRDLATTDPLTGLANRRAFLDEATLTLARGRRLGHGPVLMMIDVDHFKRINDTHGHPVGDQVLQALSTSLTQALRDIDLLGRLGGEEFAVVLPDATRAGALIAAERLRAACAALRLTPAPAESASAARPGPGGESLSVTISIGIAQARLPKEGLNELLVRADTALFQAKREGRNRCVFAEET